MAELLDIPRLGAGIDREVYDGDYSFDRLALIHRTGLPLDLVAPRYSDENEGFILRNGEFITVPIEEFYKDKPSTLTCPNPEAEDDIFTYAVISQPYGKTFSASLTIYERTVGSSAVGPTGNTELNPAELDKLLRSTMLGAIALEHEMSMLLTFEDIYKQPVIALDELREGLTTSVKLTHYLNGDASAGTPDVLAAAQEIDPSMYGGMATFVAGTIDEELLRKISQPPVQA
ncbi:MAG: hypothetical protein JWL89_358 [Candidatus Saccharibacteria bacterium]|nr:hypothetical protein [Candidatus Saccharibacteria bacterium]